MIKYFQTTTMILVWCLILSLLCSWLSYKWVSFRRSRPRHLANRGMAVLPALVVGPVSLVLAHRIFGVNLLYPLHFFATTSQLVFAALVPAVILTTASGLFVSIIRATSREYCFWRNKPFALVAEATGQSADRALKKLIYLKVLTRSWTQCLPWLFGELIVVEAVYNAPGMGLDAWHKARTFDYSGLVEVLIWLAVLYAGCVFASASVSQWVGKKLETYG